MSKMLKLKEWMPVGEAARHLSKALDEDVSPADIYQLALDELLVLSIRCPTPVPGLRVEYHDAADDSSHLIGPALLSDAPIHYVGEFVETFDGVFDLPMIGGERVVLRGVEWSPETELEDFTFDEVLLRTSDDVLFCVMERVENEAPVKSWNHKDNFVNRYSLPGDARFVVRTAAMNAFLERIPDERTPVSRGLSPREETTNLNIIGGLLELLLGKTPAGKQQSIFEGQAAIIDALIAHNPSAFGISKTTLELRFAEAKRRLHST